MDTVAMQWTPSPCNDSMGREPVPILTGVRLVLGAELIEDLNCVPPTVALANAPRSHRNPRVEEHLPRPHTCVAARPLQAQSPHPASHTWSALSLLVGRPGSHASVRPRPAELSDSHLCDTCVSVARAGRRHRGTDRVDQRHARQNTSCIVKISGWRRTSQHPLCALLHALSQASRPRPEV